MSEPYDPLYSAQLELIVSVLSDIKEICVRSGIKLVDDIKVEIFYYLEDIDIWDLGLLYRDSDYKYIIDNWKLRPISADKVLDEE